jgi:hypothetical protein
LSWRREDIILVNTKDSALFFKKNVPFLSGETMVESFALCITPHCNTIYQTVVRVPPLIRQLMLIGNRPLQKPIFDIHGSVHLGNVYV